jgi:hypothetical protein
MPRNAHAENEKPWDVIISTAFFANGIRIMLL